MLHLTENRRSRAAILACAGELIAQNPPPGSSAALRLERRPLRSARDAATGTKKLPAAFVDAVITRGGDSEAAYVAERIQARQPQLACHCTGTPHRYGWCNFAVLYRSHAHRQPLARELAARGIPFVVKGLGIRNTPEGRDLLAVLRAIAEPSHAVSVLRVSSASRWLRIWTGSEDMAAISAAR